MHQIDAEVTDDWQMKYQSEADGQPVGCLFFLGDVVPVIAIDGKRLDKARIRSITGFKRALCMALDGVKL